MPNARFSTVTVIVTAALSLVAGGLVLTRLPESLATGTTRPAKPVVYRKLIAQGDASAHVLGTVPAQSRLFLRDFYADGVDGDSSGDGIQILVDGAVTYTVTVGSTGSDLNRPMSFAVGLPIEAGREVAVRRMNRYSPGGDVDLIVGASLEPVPPRP